MKGNIFLDEGMSSRIEEPKRQFVSLIKGACVPRQEALLEAYFAEIRYLGSR